MRRVLPLIVLLASLAPGVASAEQVAAGMAVPFTMPAPSRPMVVPPGRRAPPPDLLRPSELRAALSAAREDLEACLAGTRGRRASVRASLDPIAGLSVRVTTRPRDAALDRCLDTAARRWLVRFEGLPVRARTSASITLRSPRGPDRPPIAPPPTPPPTTPPPPSNAYSEAAVRTALELRRAALLDCLGVGPGEGTMGVRVVVAPNGALELLGVDLPPGVGSGPVLTCLRGVVARVRVPAPPSARTIEHTLSLAR